ncbi:hypothetical protein GCM10009846_00770 [Agrococcus versicolor]|uniref:HTH tetR-type domain-containing protein n=1 Tax=Agrococcus versicolor TaxID=501482 RepID=A0ABP5M8H9_9MICO
MDATEAEPGAAAMRREPSTGQAADTANRLLDAAAAIIAERGIDRLSTTDVGIRAGTSVGTVYRYFEDRDALIRALYERSVAHVRHALIAAAATSQGTLEADVRALLAAYLHEHRTLPAYQAVRTWQWLRHDAHGHRTIAVDLSAHDLLSVLGPRYGLALDDARSARIATAVRRADALVLAAFLDEPDLDDASAVELLAATETMLVAAILAALAD